MNTLIRWLRRLLELMLGRPMTTSRPHPTQNRPMPMSDIQSSQSTPTVTPIPPVDLAPSSLADDAPDLPSADDIPQESTDLKVMEAEVDAEIDMETDAETEVTETTEATETAEEEESQEPVDVTALSSELTGLLEALLFVADSPTHPAQFAQALQRPEIDVRAGLADLQTLYKETGRGLRLQERNDRFSLVTAPQAAAAIENFLNLDLSSRLSAPALETLAIVAYRQPVTKSQVEAVRGVDCSGVLRTLLQRELIEETGRLDTVGRPILYGVTDTFMQHFGLENMQELPPLQTPDADALWAATELAEEGEG